MSKLTKFQLEALADLSDGQLKYGIHIRGRRSLPSLRRHGYVSQLYGDRRNGSSADRWQILPAGLAAFKQFGTIKHLRERAS
jgi:hypothetical protein